MAITMATGFLVVDSAVVDYDPVDVSDGGQVLSFNGRELKKAKGAKKAKKGSSYASPTIEDIEGMYVYTGCDNNVFQASISCGIFGDGDQDLCLYQELKIGQLSDKETSSDSAPTSDGNYFNPDSVLGSLTASPDDVCVFSGTFRASAALQGSNILSIPLATSNGCQNVEQNFLYTVKMEVNGDGSLKLDFSDDGGFTYYTQEGEQCPKKYVANKFWEMEEMVAKSAERAVCSDERRILKHGRRLCPPCIVIVVVGGGGSSTLATGAAVVSAIATTGATLCLFLCSF